MRALQIVERLVAGHGCGHGPQTTGQHDGVEEEGGYDGRQQHQVPVHTDT